MNIIQIAGHLGSDVETRFTADGLKVSSFRVATNVRRGNRDETIWWRVTLWGDRFDKMLPYLKKGSAIIVVGEFSRAEIYTDREGKQQVSLDIRAEFIRFNPFPRGERTGQEQQSTGAAYSGNAGTPHQAAEGHGFGNDFGQESAPARAPAAGRGAAHAAPLPPLGDQDLPF